MKGQFPVDNQEIVVNVPYQDFINEFKKHVQLTGYIPLFKDKKSSRFFGTITPEVWKIILKTNYRNSFKPVIYMRVFPEGKMTRVKFEFKVHIAVRIFLVVILIIPLFMILHNILSQGAVEAYYFPVGIIAASMILANLGFYMSLDHTAEALNTITGQIVATAGK